MNQIFTKIEFITALQACGLGALIGATFAFFKLKPPTPDNIAGIFGIIGIFTGWIIMSHFLEK